MTAMPRSIWKGAVSFGLVSIPVAMYTATENRSPSFKQLRKGDHSPIRYKRVAEADGEEVQWDDIVKGYEVSEGEFVLMAPEEIKAAIRKLKEAKIDRLQLTAEELHMIFAEATRSGVIEEEERAMMAGIICL